MKEITLSQFKKLAHWEIDRELERYGSLAITYFGTVRWVLKASPPQGKEDERK